MKIVKRILIGLLAIIALLLIAALFVPKEFKAGAEIVINRPVPEVFDYIRHIRNQDNYGKWQLMDPGMEKSYEGEDGTVGFVYNWDSDKLGKGSQKITKIVEGKRLETDLSFGFGAPAKSTFTTAGADGSKTKVTWGITGRSGYPFNLVHLFFKMDNDFEEGLKNLKKELEQ